MIKIIFFDFDGVIVESVDIKTKAFAKLFNNEDKVNLREILDYHLNNIGISRYEKFRHIYKTILRRPISEGQFQKLCIKFANLVIDNVVAAPYVKGANEFFKKYATKYKCFILSATPKKELIRIISRRNIRHFFKGIYGSPESKSDTIRRILIKENIKPKYTVYIGDSLSDYRAAKDNSVHFIARTNCRGALFKGINCIQVNNLVRLEERIKDIVQG